MSRITEHFAEGMENTCLSSGVYQCTVPSNRLLLSHVQLQTCVGEVESDKSSPHRWFHGPRFLSWVAWSTTSPFPLFPRLCHLRSFLAKKSGLKLRRENFQKPWFVVSTAAGTPQRTRRILDSIAKTFTILAWSGAIAHNPAVTNGLNKNTCCKTISSPFTR